MQTNNLNTVKVLFTDSKYNYETNVSSNSTEQTAKEYFVNKTFDLGIYPKEDFQKCIGIEFTDNNSMVLQYKLPRCSKKHLNDMFIANQINFKIK